MLSRRPAFSFLAVAVAVGIGANTVVFSVVSAMRLRQLFAIHTGRSFRPSSRPPGFEEDLPATVARAADMCARAGLA